MRLHQVQSGQAACGLTKNGKEHLPSFRAARAEYEITSERLPSCDAQTHLRRVRVPVFYAKPRARKKFRRMPANVLSPSASVWVADSASRPPRHRYEIAVTGPVAFSGHFGSAIMGGRAGAGAGVSKITRSRYRDHANPTIGDIFRKSEHWRSAVPVA